MHRTTQQLDPLTHLHRRGKVVIAIGVFLMIVCSTWAIWPLSEAEATDTEIIIVEPQQQLEDIDHRSVDVAIFKAAKLWNPVPLPLSDIAKVDTPDPSIPRPNLKLIGIIQDDTGLWKAALYNIDSDRLLIVASGDSIEPYVVESIDGNAIVLRHGSYRNRLSVKRERSNS